MKEIFIIDIICIIILLPIQFLLSLNKRKAIRFIIPISILGFDLIIFGLACYNRIKLPHPSGNLLSAEATELVYIIPFCDLLGLFFLMLVPAVILIIFDFIMHSSKKHEHDSHVFK